MADIVDETAYYFHRESLVLALISEGVRFPAGRWMRVLNSSVRCEHVEQMLGKVFPELKGKVLIFVTLTSNADVDAFERSFVVP